MLNLRVAKERITSETVRDIAQGTSQREKIGDFDASYGWLSNFMDRNKFSFRRVTNLIAVSDDKLLQSSF